MLESISDTFLSTTNKEFRVLIAIENKMKFYEWVPLEELVCFTNYDIKDVEYILSTLAKNKLIHRNIRAYEGYRIYFEAYDLLALNAFVKRGTINAMGDAIGAGKESHVYEATGGIIDRHVIIKFHREGKTSFKQVRTKREYVGERKHLSWLYASRLAAKREHDALSTLYPEVSVPEPIDYNRHAIVMSVAKGQQLAHTKINEPGWYLDEILGEVRKAYKLGIIHGDLSEFNIFVSPEGAEIIDWPQYITPAHINARELLRRDVDNVLSFFNRKYRIKRDALEVMNNIVT
ncbi:MAG: RIO1 family regulatory kinase/ATPase [Candidatus Methanoperedens sp.]|nr:serine/threonine protein kinase [Candidatus Methanoperedens sp.]MCZ7395572.1 serine/threonine protein kinase [Candidatus Methanoperedens sp.]